MKVKLSEIIIFLVLLIGFGIIPIFIDISKIATSFFQDWLFNFLLILASYSPATIYTSYLIRKNKKNK